MKKTPPILPIETPEPAIGKGVKFCLNCDEMDDLAVSEEADSPEELRKRFQNCDKNGKFDGDICSRLFVAEASDDPGPMFEEE